jgi:hypothetical protein
VSVPGRVTATRSNEPYAGCCGDNYPRYLHQQVSGVNPAVFTINTKVVVPPDYARTVTFPEAPGNARSARG